MAFDVVRRFKDFGEYGSEAKALRALKRRRPHFSAEQYETAFREAAHLYDVAAEVVGTNKDELIANWDRLHEIEHAAIDAERRERCPGSRGSTRNTALGWIFYWHHLR